MTRLQSTYIWDNASEAIKEFLTAKYQTMHPW